MPPRLSSASLTGVGKDDTVGTAVETIRSGISLVGSSFGATVGVGAESREDSDGGAAIRVGTGAFSRLVTGSVPDGCGVRRGCDSPLSSEQAVIDNTSDMQRRNGRNRIVGKFKLHSHRRDGIYATHRKEVLYNGACEANTLHLWK